MYTLAFFILNAAFWAKRHWLQIRILLQNLVLVGYFFEFIVAGGGDLGFQFGGVWASEVALIIGFRLHFLFYCKSL